LSVPVPQGAVFLSYASEDADAARRICEALRAAGIEVWFDQSELRGGDAWDQMIRHRIRDCALFLPIISAHSQARLEGYFRREWKLAVDRTHDMADEKPFLVPITIDATRETQAKVPEAFRAVQWTHLPQQSVPAEFTGRILKLLTAAEPAPALANAAHPHVPTPAARIGRAQPGVALVLLLAAGVAAIAYLAYQRFAAPGTAAVPAAPAMPALPSPNAAGLGGIPPKSIAVLPFIDLSEKKDQEYFSDGLSEELLDLLAQVPDLSVAARTSSFYFKGKSEDMAAIGRKLRVAHVLEGSVRRAGGTLRVTAQLISTDNGYHLWSKTYDRDVKDIFKVQDDIANAVVEALKAKLLPAQHVMNRHETGNTEAYTQYLLGNQYRGYDTPASNAQALAAYKRAVSLDPDYAAAFGGIADAEWRIADQGTGEPAAFQRAVEAADKAIALAPESPEGYWARGQLRFAYFYDWQGAEQDNRKAMTLDANFVPAAVDHAYVLATLGRVPEAISALSAIVAAKPLAEPAWRALTRLQIESGDLESARQELLQLQQASPAAWTAWALGFLELRDGRPVQAVAAFDSVGANPISLLGRAMAEHTMGHAAESQRALDSLIKNYAHGLGYQIAEAYAWRGERDKAFEWLERAYRQHDGGITYLGYDHSFSGLRNDPRYKALAGKLHLPD
jgi:TolB-like protein